MSKFNNAAKVPMTTNDEGMAAYKMADKSKLLTQVLTSFFNEAMFYGDNSDDIRQTIVNVIGEDPEFVSKLAIFARREFNMRSISHVLAGYLAHEEKGKPFVKKTVKSIVLRGDDATEILSFYLNTFGKPIPNSLRKALRDIFPTFDAYTLAKYKGEGKSVKMRDILCLCRPSPLNDEQSALWKSLLESTIQPAYTWETELSAKGNNKETWEGLIRSGRLPYMAALRNLNNIVKAGPDNMDRIIDYIQDPTAVRNSKQLPFRYLSAYRKLKGDFRGIPNVLDALENAADASIENLPRLPGKTAIAIDVSGSMMCPISARSDVSCKDIAVLLGMIANRICEQSVVYAFDDTIRHLRYIPKRNGLLDSVDRFGASGGGTNMTLPFQQMLQDYSEGHGDYDRVIILSDNECNSTFGWYCWDNNRTVQQCADAYRRKSGNDVWVHAVDLCGYGTQQFAGPKTNIVAGWSEKIFEFILLAEQGEGSLMKRIQEYTV